MPLNWRRYGAEVRKILACLGQIFRTIFVTGMSVIIWYRNRRSGMNPIESGI